MTAVPRDAASAYLQEPAALNPDLSRRAILLASCSRAPFDALLSDFDIVVPDLLYLSNER